ncbi:MAG: JAB domain-containing protein, partial [Burkholderiaceae bacterium]
LFQGTLSQTTVYPREIAVRALYHHAASVILAHNHPSGLPTPSEADKRVTEAIQAALRPLDIAVLDHCIVAGPAVYSMAENGLMPMA